MPRARSGSVATERAVVARLARLFGVRAGRAVRVAIGDDAAVLERPRGPVAWTVDVAVEHVHFERAWLSDAEIGARAFHAAVSDLAAMGASPIGALSSLVVPPGFGSSAIAALTRGQARAARALGCPVVGGNLSRGGELSVTTTAVGLAPAPLLRSGARSGDEVWLLGDVGMAAVGLRLLSQGEGRGGAASAAGRACIRAWRRPEARLADGASLVGRATACIDVSDGLAGDLDHVARESGVGVVVDAVALARALSPAFVRACAALGLEPIATALHGGEDYALAATGPTRSRPPAARVIGRVVRGRGVRLRQPDGTLVPAGAGFDHFAVAAPSARGRSAGRR